jgi:hypothetical protein
VGLHQAAEDDRFVTARQRTTPHPTSITATNPQ